MTKNVEIETVDYEYSYPEDVDIQIDGYGKVRGSKGLEFIIKTLFYWNIPMTACYITDENIRIIFSELYDLEKFLQRVLHHNTVINGEGYKYDTLWNFFEENLVIDVIFDEECIDDPNNEDTVVGVGVLELDYAIYFSKELLEEFKKLFFETFPVNKYV